MTSISLLWGIGSILSDKEIKESFARRVKGLAVCGEAENGKEAIEKAHSSYGLS